VCSKRRQTIGSPTVAAWFGLTRIVIHRVWAGGLGGAARWLLHAWTGGYTAVSAFFLLMGMASICAAIGAGRNRHVSARRATWEQEIQSISARNLKGPSYTETPIHWQEG
jgi:hypothetical protein